MWLLLSQNHWLSLRSEQPPRNLPRNNKPFVPFVLSPPPIKHPASSWATDKKQRSNRFIYLWIKKKPVPKMSSASLPCMFPPLSVLQELINAAMRSTSLGGMAGGGGGGGCMAAVGGLGGGGASGLGGENGRVVAHDFPKAGAHGLPCMSKAAGLGLSSTGMWSKRDFWLDRTLLSVCLPDLLYVKKLRWEKMEEKKGGKNDG